MRFIPIDKMSKLREASKNGDANAIKILDLQMSGGDFGGLLDEYFQPKPEPQEQQGAVETGKSLPEQGGQSKLEQFLAFNNVSKDSPDYDSFVEDFYNEFPNERPNAKQVPEQVEGGNDSFLLPLIQEEIKAIGDYNNAIMKVMEMDELGDAAKKGIMTKLEEIKRDEMEHLDELKRIKTSLEKKEGDNL